MLVRIAPTLTDSRVNAITSLSLKFQLLEREEGVKNATITVPQEIRDSFVDYSEEGCNLLLEESSPKTGCGLTEENILIIEIDLSATLSDSFTIIVNHFINPRSEYPWRLTATLADHGGTKLFIIQSTHGSLTSSLGVTDAVDIITPQQSIVGGVINMQIIFFPTNNIYAGGKITLTFPNDTFINPGQCTAIPNQVLFIYIYTHTHTYIYIYI